MSEQIERNSGDPAAVFAALGDRTRMSLLASLSKGARSIAGLSADTHLTRQAVTKHLRVLEKAGLVSSARVGRETRFCYRGERMDAAKAYLDTVSWQGEGQLARLRSSSEG